MIRGRQDIFQKPDVLAKYWQRIMKKGLQGKHITLYWPGTPIQVTSQMTVTEVIDDSHSGILELVLVTSRGRFEINPKNPWLIHTWAN